ncbi:MAG: hypothetical protein WC680_10265 [Sulfuricurvum sp.]|jgi:hypothetical protein
MKKYPQLNIKLIHSSSIIIERSAAIKIHAHKEGYIQNAILPEGKWEEITKDEMESLRNKQNHNISNTIYILKIPINIMDLFEELGCQYLTINSPNIRNIDEYSYEKLIASLNNFFETFVQYTNNKITYPGISISEKNRVSVSYDSSRKLYVGMHIDSWDKLNIYNRDESQNRIMINLSLETRYLLCIEKTYNEMIYLLNPSFSDKEKAKYYNDPSKLLIEFISKFPFTTIIRIPIKHGEAYIAPTENIPHDGSSLYKNTSDIVFSGRGYLKPY